ncbi:MAG: diguanylate cyclase [Alphaproteobacteria bacterium]|nr:diguanylate cyclase [Alphaproteobacteria bacterium]
MSEQALRHDLDRRDYRIAPRHDAETGTLNRYGMVETLRREIGRCKRGLSRGGVLVKIEIDNLLTIEKQHGTEAAIFCMRNIFTTLQAMTRPMDVLARIERHHIMLLLPEAYIDVSLQRLHRMARDLNRLTFLWNGAHIPVVSSLCLKNYDAHTEFKDLVSDEDESEEEGESLLDYILFLNRFDTSADPPRP